jgi:hypothetical protein
VGLRKGGSPLFRSSPGCGDIVRASVLTRQLPVFCRIASLPQLVMEVSGRTQRQVTARAGVVSGSGPRQPSAHGRCRRRSQARKSESPSVFSQSLRPTGCFGSKAASRNPGTKPSGDCFQPIAKRRTLLEGRICDVLPSVCRRPRGACTQSTFPSSRLGSSHQEVIPL